MMQVISQMLIFQQIIWSQMQTILYQAVNIPSQDATYDPGTATEQWNVIYGHTVEATYAHLAERYAADAPHEPVQF